MEMKTQQCVFVPDFNFPIPKELLGLCCPTTEKILNMFIINEGDEKEMEEETWEQTIQRVYPELGLKIGKLVSEKQLAYGDSFGKSGDVMRLLYPNGITADQMDDALTIVRILDKLFRIATKKDAFSEEPYKDICGYGLLGWYRDEQTKKQWEQQRKSDS